VYSTCSIFAEQNDDVAQSCLPDMLHVGPEDVATSLALKSDPVRCRHGLMLLPHLHQSGPMYISVFQKAKSEN
jgi:16S rRNA C967 or C1407 C5-methylase (RsmB/RsmF family)